MYFVRCVSLSSPEAAGPKMRRSRARLACGVGPLARGEACKCHTRNTRHPTQHWAGLARKRRQLPEEAKALPSCKSATRRLPPRRSNISKRPHAGPMQVPSPRLTSRKPSPQAHQQPITAPARGPPSTANARVTKRAVKGVATNTTLHLPACRGRMRGLAGAARG